MTSAMHWSFLVISECIFNQLLISMKEFFFYLHHIKLCLLYKDMAHTVNISLCQTISILARPVFDQLLSWVLGKKPVVQIG